MSARQGRTATIHGVEVNEAQARATLLMLRDHMAGALPGYLETVGTDENGQGWDDCVRFVEKCIDQHTESIGDGFPVQDRGDVQ